MTGARAALLLAVLTGGAVLAGGSPGGAAAPISGSGSAATAAPDGSSYTPEQLAASIVPLDRGVVPLDRRVGPLGRNIEPLESIDGDDAGTTITLKADILFDFASSELSEAATSRIGELVEDIPEGVRVIVAGHTDSIGSDAANMTLSQQRARGVAGAIAAARPDLELTVEGHGETRPVADNSRAGEDYPEGRALNRRVEIHYAN